MTQPNSNTFTHTYRRGVVLGLSLGEVFIILLFLLLFFLVSKIDEMKVERQALQHQLQRATSEIERVKAEKRNVQDKLAKLVSKMAKGKVITEEDFNELFKAQRNAAALQKLIDELTPYSDLARPIVEELQIGGVSDEMTQEFFQSLAEQISRMTPPQVQKIIAKITSPQALKAMSEQTEREASKNREIAELTSKLDALSQEKGQLPPCWYKQTIDKNLRKEREIKSFDIRMFDQRLIVVQRPMPQPTNDINLGNLSIYPSIDKEHLNRPITYSLFEKKFSPFLKLADQKKIQNYRCRFHVAIWDSTSSKAIYKRRLTQVEGIFFKYEYKQDPWPHEEWSGQ